MKYFLSIYLLYLISVGCTKIEVEENPLYFFWEEMDKKYVFFEEKRIDWDSVRSTLGGYDPKNDSDLVSGFTNMIALLKDRHVWINTGKREISYSPNDYFFSSINLKFYSSGRLQENDVYSIAQLHKGVVFIELKTFYVPFPNFEETIKNYDYSNGIIIDIRHNSGGYIKNTLEIASNFISGRHPVLYQKFKRGSKHTDFTHFKPIYLYGSNRFPGTKIVLLVDKMTYSSANSFASIIKNFTNAVIIGDKSGGGGAVSLQGILPNGWRYSISENAYFDTHYASLESGVVPHYRVIFNRELYEQQKPRHNQFEFAYKLLTGEG